MPCHHWGVTFTLDKKTAENQCSLIGSEIKSLAQTQKKKKEKKSENYEPKMRLECMRNWEYSQEYV